MSADARRPVTKPTGDNFPGKCAGCDKILWTKDVWAGHQTAAYCDGGGVIPGLEGGVEP